MRSIFLLWALLFVFTFSASSQLIVDHTCTNINEIPQWAIEQAKEQLHIAYGHTSHGSQVTDGMEGLVEFANGGGYGLSLPQDIFQWNHGGSDGALDLHDYAMDGDVGYWPDWYNNTTNYLDDTESSDVNVVMWSWCGQVGDKYASGVLWSEFLGPMNTLEATYPDITFVYMTGHLNYWDRENTNAANDSIRSFFWNNGKVLFDFADIESYAPDGTCYKENGDDACDYYNEDGDSVGNWAVEYQDIHTEGSDWYDCSSAHSEPLNANRKAYAAWWMFASLAGWNYNPTTVADWSIPELNCRVYPNPASDIVTVEITGNHAGVIRIDLLSASGGIIERYTAPAVPQDTFLFQIKMTNLDPAPYYLNIISPDKSILYKILVIH